MHNLWRFTPNSLYFIFCAGIRSHLIEFVLRRHLLKFRNRNSIDFLSFTRSVVANAISTIRILQKKFRNYTLQMSHFKFSWCSDYHICLTHRKFTVRNRAETSLLFIHSVRAKSFSGSSLHYSIISYRIFEIDRRFKEISIS